MPHPPEANNSSNTIAESTVQSGASVGVEEIHLLPSERRTAQTTTVQRAGVAVRPVVKVRPVPGPSPTPTTTTTITTTATTTKATNGLMPKKTVTWDDHLEATGGDEASGVVGKLSGHSEPGRGHTAEVRQENSGRGDVPSESGVQDTRELSHAKGPAKADGEGRARPDVGAGDREKLVGGAPQRARADDSQARTVGGKGESSRVAEEDKDAHGLGSGHAAGTNKRVHLGVKRRRSFLDDSTAPTNTNTNLVQIRLPTVIGKSSPGTLVKFGPDPPPPQDNSNKRKTTTKQPPNQSDEAPRDGLGAVKQPSNSSDKDCIGPSSSSTDEGLKLRLELSDDEEVEEGVEDSIQVVKESPELDKYRHQKRKRWPSLDQDTTTSTTITTSAAAGAKDSGRAGLRRFEINPEKLPSLVVARGAIAPRPPEGRGMPAATGEKVSLKIGGMPIGSSQANFIQPSKRRRRDQSSDDDHTPVVVTGSKEVSVDIGALRQRHGHSPNGWSTPERGVVSKDSESDFLSTPTRRGASKRRRRLSSTESWEEGRGRGVGGATTSASNEGGLGAVMRREGVVERVERRKAGDMPPLKSARVGNVYSPTSQFYSKRGTSGLGSPRPDKSGPDSSYKRLVIPQYNSGAL